MKQTNRKPNRIFKVFTTLALALSLCLGSMASVLAAPVTGGTPTNPLTAAITKDLQMPDGTVAPTDIFSFAVTAVSVDGVAAATAGNMPGITPSTIAFNAASSSSSAGGVTTLTDETANIFAGVTWPHAGVYEYEITEIAGTNTDITYSQAAYTMKAHVVNDGSAGLYIESLEVYATKDDNGNTIASPTKVDPTPGTGGGLKFTNSYIESATGVIPGTDDMLTISKLVPATGGSYGDQTKYFDFSVELTKAALVSGTPTYKVYVMEAGAVVTAAANYIGTIQTDAQGDYIEVTAGTAETISLKHGQSLSFVGLPVGTSYTVTESAYTSYIPSVSVVEDGGTPVVTNGTLNTALTIGSPNPIIIGGTGVNTATYTNTHDATTVTPTGIMLNNLPYVMMLGLAVLALTAFVIVKSRKRTNAAR